jgi:hypothetical protein
MKHNTQYIVYSVKPKKQVTGLIGNIDIYVVQLLLAGGKIGIEETVNSENHIEFYSTFLEEQGMIIKSTHHEIIKDIHRIWIEIDNEKTNFKEYSTWKEVDMNDMETLAWKPYWIPCLEGTKMESLGLSVISKEMNIFAGKYRVSVYDILTTILDLMP